MNQEGESQPTQQQGAYATGPGGTPLAEVKTIGAGHDRQRLERGGYLGEVSVRRTVATLDDTIALYALIRRASQRVGFNNYEAFIGTAFQEVCGDNDLVYKSLRGGRSATVVKRNSKRELGCSTFTGVRAYEFLKEATDLFLMAHCGVVATDDELKSLFGSYAVDPPLADTAVTGPPESPTFFTDKDAQAASSRLEVGVGVADLNERAQSYMSRIPTTEVDMLPLLARLRRKFADVPVIEECGDGASEMGLLACKLRNPVLLELIWSYWMEQGMLVQGINAVSLRFQNRRIGGRDPLARLDVMPLRPLSSLLWGYIQDEQNRLSVPRRAYEYDHHYGLRLKGKAVPALQSAESRTQFLTSFHNLLREACRYYKALQTTIVNPDPFPALNTLKELHLLLAEGMVNQFGDLPTTARAEMLMQQWLLAAPPMQDFLGGRPSVPYPENWMPHVDSLRSMFGWGDVTVRHFRDLAYLGERLLLSVRYGDWSDSRDANAADLWMRFWREEVQAYAHAYRAVTGVDLAADEVRTVDASLFATQPADLVIRRMRAAQADALPASAASNNGQLIGR